MASTSRASRAGRRVGCPPLRHLPVQLGRDRLHLTAAQQTTLNIIFLLSQSKNHIKSHLPKVYIGALCTSQDRTDSTEGPGPTHRLGVARQVGEVHAGALPEVHVRGGACRAARDSRPQRQGWQVGPNIGPTVQLDGCAVNWCMCEFYYNADVYVVSVADPTRSWGPS
jgi:hypothetical protein